VFPDDARAFLCGCELSVPGQAGLTIAEILEGHRLCELRRFNVIAAAVVIDDAFRRNDSVKGNAILIVAAVRSMHDEAPAAAGTKIVGMRRGSKAVGPHHYARCFGFVHTENTSARGASNAREPMIEHGSWSRLMLFLTAMTFLPLVLFLFGLQHL